MKSLLRTLLFTTAMLLSLSLTWNLAYADELPYLKEVPSELPHQQRNMLDERREQLVQTQNELLADTKTFNKKDVEDQTDTELNSLVARQKAYIPEAKAFNKDVMAAIKANQKRIIQGIMQLVSDKKWPDKKRSDLEAALKEMEIPEGDPNTTDDQFFETWQAIQNRWQDASIVKDAESDSGPAQVGAGKQTDFNDCAIFALANGSGIPYSVVAARANELMSNAQWRDPSDRENSQKAIESHGLTGFETVLVGEELGHVKIVSSLDFPDTLKDGHSVIVGVAVPDGKTIARHEVVLSRTFQHVGETWFEMIDSNRTPGKWRYLSAKELNFIILEKGIVYYPEAVKSPEIGRTPELLHKPVDQGSPLP